MGKFHLSPKDQVVRLEEGNVREWDAFGDEKPSSAVDRFKSKRFVIGLVVAVMLLVLSNFGALLAAVFIDKDNQQNQMIPTSNEANEINSGFLHSRKLGRGNTDMTTRITSYTIDEKLAKKIAIHCMSLHSVTLKRIWNDGSYSLNQICPQAITSLWDGNLLVLSDGTTIERSIQETSKFQIYGDSLLQKVGWICDVKDDCAAGEDCNIVSNRCGGEGEEGDGEPGMPGFCQPGHPFTQMLPNPDLSDGAPTRPNLDGEVGDYSAMLELPMFNGGKSGTTNAFAMEGKIATAYIAYDCEHMIVCAAVHLEQNSIDEGVEVDESDGDSWIRFGESNGATKLKQSNADDFKYIHKVDDPDYTVGYEGCWEACSIHPPLDPIINNDVEIHFNTVTGQTTSTGKQSAEGMNICLKSDCDWTECPALTTTSSTPNSGSTQTTSTENPDGGDETTATPCTRVDPWIITNTHEYKYECGDSLPSIADPDFTTYDGNDPDNMSHGEPAATSTDYCTGHITEVTWQITDSDNCEIEVDAFVTDTYNATDNKNPIIDVDTVPEDLVMDSCDYIQNSIPDHHVTASDACDGLQGLTTSVEATIEYVEEDLPPGLTITRTFVAEDACGLKSGGLDSDQQTIQVIDKCYADVDWPNGECANFPALLTIENMPADSTSGRPFHYIRITLENTESNFLGDIRGVFFDCSDGINWDIDSDGDGKADWEDPDTEGPIWIDFVEWVENQSAPPTSTTPPIAYECRPDGDFNILKGWSGGCTPDPSNLYTCAVEVGSEGKGNDDIQKVVVDVYSHAMDITTDNCARGSSLVGFRHTSVSDGPGSTSRGQSTKTKANLTCCQSSSFV